MPDVRLQAYNPPQIRRGLKIYHGDSTGTAHTTDQKIPVVRCEQGSPQAVPAAIVPVDRLCPAIIKG